MAWFVKQQNNWYDGVKVVHDMMAWLTLFSGCDSWNGKIIGVMAWKWCMAWWLYRPLFLGMNRKFCFSFTWCMIGEKVKKRIINKSPCAAICLKVSFPEAKIISYTVHIRENTDQRKRVFRHFSHSGVLVKKFWTLVKLETEGL